MWGAISRSRVSPQTEALAVGDGEEKTFPKRLPVRIPRQQQLAEACVGPRQSLVPHSVFVHDQAQILPSSQGYSITRGHEHDKLDFLNLGQTHEHVPEHRQILRQLLLGPPLMCRASSHGGGVHRHGAPADDLFELHGIHDGAQEHRSAQDRPEAGTEGLELPGHALAEEPIDVRLHTALLVGLGQLAVLRYATGARPTHISEQLGNVVANVVQQPSHGLGHLWLNRRQVLQAQGPRARRVQVVQQSSVEHSRENVRHENIVQDRLAQQDAASSECICIGGIFVKPIRPVVVA
mmetsp:Transcript_98654/g.250377  ORF Transcript_98654/g.250377 Transcript_98654/m.250377 type:complete len:293 (-) Transcript_98654:1386-2264(-)